MDGGEKLMAVMVFAVVFGIAMFLHKYREKPGATVEQSDFIHPETTETTKWIKVTPTTRDALIGLYFENMEECSKFITEENGVALGESAILYLMSCYDELMKIEEDREKRVDERAKKILGID